MKKIIVLAALFSLSLVQANAQKASTSLVAGFNMQNLNGKELDGTKLNNQLAPKYFLGALVAIPLAEDFYIQPGITYITKGAKNENGTEKTNLGYIEIPINFLFTPEFGEGHLIFGFGPYIGRGINGKVKSDLYERKVNFTNSVVSQDLLSKTTSYYKPFDFGGNVFVGFEMAQGLSVKLNTQLGMAAINPEVTDWPDDQAVLKNTGFGLSLGYKLN
jgi:hypothetical protein